VPIGKTRRPRRAFSCPLVQAPSRRIWKKRIGNPGCDQKCDDSCSDRLLPIKAAAGKGGARNGEASGGQTEQHVGQKSDKSFKVAYSLFQISRLADGVVASVPDCPGVPHHHPFGCVQTASQTVRDHGRSLHVPNVRVLSDRICSDYCI